MLFVAGFVPKAAQQCPEEVISAHVDIGAELKKITLEGLPAQCRPLQAPVDFIATEGLRLHKKHNVLQPFVFADIGKFMPTFVNSVAAPEKHERLPMWLWALAFDKYAVSAACAGQWDYVSSRAHFENCARVVHLLSFVCFANVLICMLFVAGNPRLS